MLENPPTHFEVFESTGQSAVLEIRHKGLVACWAVGGGLRGLAGSWSSQCKVEHEGSGLRCLREGAGMVNGWRNVKMLNG